MERSVPDEQGLGVQLFTFLASAASHDDPREIAAAMRTVTGMRNVTECPYHRHSACWYGQLELRLKNGSQAEG